MKLNIPNEWQQVPLEQLLEFVTGGDWGKDPMFKDSDFDLAYCIRGSEIKNWEEEKGKTASLRQIKKTSIATRQLKEGDILVEISGGGPEQPVGRTVLVDKTVLNFEPAIPKVCTNFLRLIRPIQEIDSKYLNLYLQLFYYSGDIVKYQGGSNNLRNLKFPDFIKLEIPFPPLSQQQAIVSKIEEYLSKLENGKKQLEASQQQLKVYRQSLLKRAFEGKLTNEIKKNKLPESWQMKKLNDIGTWKGGGTPSKLRKDYWSNGNILWVSPKDMKSQIIHDTIDKITVDAIENSSAKLIPKNSILFVVRSGILRRTLPIALTICDVTVNQDIQAFTPKEVLSEYIYWYIIAKNDEIRKSCSKDGTTVESIESSLLKNYLIPICAFEEQQRIVNELNSKLTICDKIEETIYNSLLQTESLKQSILKNAFEGKLISQNEITEKQVKVIKLAIEKSNSKSASLIQEEFPKIKTDIRATDLHAGILAMVIDAHEKSPTHLAKLNHVKGEKIAHLVEYKLGISLGRVPMKDAAGPDDYNHLKKVEHRASKAGFFKIQKLSIGHTYRSMKGLQGHITKIKNALTKDEFNAVNDLIQIFLKFEMEHAEVIATLYAGWNNLLIAGKSPTDEEIVYESRENWSKRKLTIDRDKFFKTLTWMKQHDFVPEGKGKMVLKKEEVNKKQVKKKKN